jgi:hypothetical protein
MLDFLKIIENIKKIENVKLDKEIAKVLSMNNDNLSKYKSKNITPIKNIVHYCLTKNLSIDEVLNTNMSFKNKFLKNDNIEIKFFESNETISIPSKFLKDLELINIYAYSKNNIELYFINTLTNSYSNPTKYFLYDKKEKHKQISFINFENDKFVIMTDKKFQNFNKDEFEEKFTIIGKISLEVTFFNLNSKINKN